jgi:hypothetical protein
LPPVLTAAPRSTGAAMLLIRYVSFVRTSRWMLARSDYHRQVKKWSEVSLSGVVFELSPTRKAYDIIESKFWQID